MLEGSHLFVGLAQIAAVLVGFAALIGVLRGDRVGLNELARIQGVAAIGLLVVVAALIPVGLAGYRVAPETLWRVSSVVFLGLNWLTIVFPIRNRARRAVLVAQGQQRPLLTTFFWLCVEIPIQVPLVIVLVGAYPARFSALYTTSLGINLFEAAFLLARLVYVQPDQDL